MPSRRTSDARSLRGVAREAITGSELDVIEQLIPKVERLVTGARRQRPQRNGARTAECGSREPKSV